MPPATPATGACWRSTATRTGSTRSGSRAGASWWSSSTGPAAGPTPRSPRSTPSPPNWRRPNCRWSRRCRTRARPCSSMRASATRCSRAAAGARRSSTGPRRRRGWGAPWAACTRWARARRLSIAAGSTSSRTCARRCARCSRARCCPTRASRATAPRSRPRCRRSRTHGRGRSRSSACACTATATPATCSGPRPARCWWTSTTRAAAPRSRTCGC